MRFAALSFLVLCLVAVTLANPANKSDNNNKKQVNTCAKECGEYEPVCAKAKNGEKERLLTFGNECVMGTYNCAHKDDPYVVKSKGECGGNVSVRLS